MFTRIRIHCLTLASYAFQYPENKGVYLYTMKVKRSDHDKNVFFQIMERIFIQLKDKSSFIYAF